MTVRRNRRSVGGGKILAVASCIAVVGCIVSLVVASNI